jgi:Xaa-Pro aminopeptidase
MGESTYASKRAKALRLANGLAKANLDAFLVSRAEDVSYLTGFGGDDSFLLICAGWSCLLTDGRYAELAQSQCPGLAIHVRTGAMTQAIANCLKERQGPAVRRLAVQAEHITLRLHDAIGKALPRVRLVGVADAVAQLRQIKDARELASISKAIKIAQTAFQAMLAQGKKGFVGRAEREIAAELDHRMCSLGADKPSFDTIVAAGPHASLPHHRPGNTIIGADDLVLIDWGAMVEGYCSDLTRVVFAGRIPPKIAEVYEVVRNAQANGLAAVRSGRSAKAVDSAARAVIAKAGFAKQFVHSLGHGLGRAVHELPGVSALSDKKLRAGMVITIEPGIYLPGLGGVRIEDDVLVGKDGPTKLSSLPTALAAMKLS